MPEGIDSKIRETRDSKCGDDCGSCERGETCEVFSLDFPELRPAPHGADADKRGR